MALNVSRYFKPHNGSSGGGTTIINVGSQNNYNTDNLNVTDINASNASISNITSDNIKATNINADNIKTNKIKADSGNIYALTSSLINGDQINASNIDTNKLNVIDEATIKNIVNNNLKANNIVTDNLTVNKTAHFFELVIDKMRSIQGTQINTAANCMLDYVEGRNGANVVTSGTIDRWRCYWKQNDDDGREISNDWLVGDQAICQSFYEGQQNKYYWRLVMATSNGTTQQYVNLNREYTDANKVKTTDDWNIQFDVMFMYGNSEGDILLDVNPTGASTFSSDTWTPTTLQDGLTLSNNDYFLKGGTLYFETHYLTKINISIVYDDGTVVNNLAENYANTYSITTDANKNVAYFLLTPAIIETWQACHWIELSYSDKDPDCTDIPEPNDNLAQLGYRSGGSRASAIIIAAYETPDAGVTPPSYAQYQGITNYNLSSHRKTFFDANGGTVIGNFKVDTGSSNIDLDDYIKSLQTTNPINVLVANPQDVPIELIALQVDNSNKIYDLNNWPGALPNETFHQIAFIVKNENTPINPQNLASCYINMFGGDQTYGRTLDLLNFTSDSAEGIYVDSVLVGSSSFPIIVVDFEWRNTSETGGGQTITSSSFSITGTYTLNGTTYNFSKNMPIITVQDRPGTDGELWLLSKIQEDAVVDANKHLTVALKYGIHHLVGANVTSEDPSANMSCEMIITKTDNTQTVTNLNYDQTNHYYYYNDTSITNYFTGAVPVNYLINFKINGDIVDSTIVNVILAGRSLFTVEDNLIQQIVTGDTGLGTQIGNVSVQANQIQASVTNLSNGISQTGINITDGTIELKAGKVNFTYSGQQPGDDPKISINPQDGTLNAVNANLSGIFTSENTQALYKTIIDANNGGAKFYSPQYVNSETHVPVAGTTQELTAEINWAFSPSASGEKTMGQVKLYDSTDAETQTIVDAYGIEIKNHYNNITANIDGLNYNNELSLAWSDLVGQRLALFRTSTEQSLTNPYTLKLNQTLIIVNHSGSTDFTLLLPAASSCPGKIYFIKNRRNGDLYINTSGGNIIDEDSTGTLSKPFDTDDQSCIFASDGSDWITFSDIS